jgi:hypothetical protein
MTVRPHRWRETSPLAAVDGKPPSCKARQIGFDVAAEDEGAAAVLTMGDRAIAQESLDTGQAEAAETSGIGRRVCERIRVD